MKKQDHKLGEHCRKIFGSSCTIFMMVFWGMLGTLGLLLYYAEMREADCIEYNIHDTDHLCLFVGGFGERWNKCLTDAAVHLFSSKHYVIGHWNQLEKLKQKLEKTNKNILIIGHSWGADTAIRLALYFPDKNISVITLDPVGSIPDLHKVQTDFPWLNIKCNPATATWSDLELIPK